MSNTKFSEFNDFVKRQLAFKTDPVNWNDVRDEWQAKLSELYKDIENFLGEYIENGSISCEYNEITLTEENIGHYLVDKLTINIGNKKITFTPIGTLLIGAKGRVDVLGSVGKCKIVLTDAEARSASDMIKINIIEAGNQNIANQTDEQMGKPIEWKWKIVSPPPARYYTELNKETFTQMILEISNG